MNRNAAFRLLCAWCAARLLSACAVPAADPRTRELVPDRESFAPVAQVLERHCGSLDCHGNRQRNLRIYGNESLRLEASDRPLAPACTSDGEVEQDYESAVALEPEIMSAVVADGGGDPERLTLIRKARGEAADRCLTSWLASRTDRATCVSAFPASSCFP